MTYEQFAHWYDELMSDAPYDAWCQLVINTLTVGQGKRVLDVGCGTGELAIRLAKRSFDVTGVDLSEQMLAIAQQKAEAHGVFVPFFQQDMRELDGFAPFDAIVMFCDSLNYLLTEEDVLQTFQRVHAHLRAEGLFLFDVHSLFKIEEVFLKQQTFASVDERVSYIWNCFRGEWAHSVEHELTFFVQREDGAYERFDEVHVQRTFPIEHYVQWLQMSGFSLLNVSGDFDQTPPTNESERIFFVAQKK